MTWWRTCLIDPPWMERGGGKIKRGADRHYPLMRTADMPAAIVNSGMWNPAIDAHMYMCVTDNFLEDGLQLVERLRFRYVRMLHWVKTTKDGQYLHTGIGQYFRSSSETILFCVRGNGLAVRTPAMDIRNVLFAPPTKHSEKPDRLYEVIESRSHGPYAEFFARRQRPGWESWGNELETPE